LKFDIVMWAKNGAWSLPRVFSRINEVIPLSSVNQRIYVDDHSIDDSVEIAKSFGWSVYKNEGAGLSDGANTALKHVETPYFISFERDIVLAEDWWEKIPPQVLGKHKVLAAQGIRLPDHPILRKLQEYRTERMIKTGRSTQSLDNTMFNTTLLRGLGGFPKIKKAAAGVDSILVQKALRAGYEWKTDFSVMSLHLRKGVCQELRHYYRYGVYSNIVKKYDKSINMLRFLKMLFFSPIRGFDIAVKKRCIWLWPLYLTIRLYAFLGYLHGYFSLSHEENDV